MVYRNILNTTTFEDQSSGIGGNSEANVRLTTDEYEFVKTANPVDWSGEDPLTYTITLTVAEGSADLTDLTITDVLPDGVTFIPASVQINGATSTNFDDTNLPTILFGTVTPLVATNAEPLVITFQVENETP